MIQEEVELKLDESLPKNNTNEPKILNKIAMEVSNEAVGSLFSKVLGKKLCMKKKSG